MLNMFNTNVKHSQFFDSQCLTCSSCYMIYLDSINSVTFVSFLNFLVSRTFFIMLKCCLDHFFLTQFILAEDVQMLSSCDHCARQRKSCVVSDKSDKCSECVHSKKTCLLFSDFLIMNIA